MVKDVYPGAIGSYPQNLINVNGTLFYQAFDPHGGYELFRSDGTAVGTYMVKDISPGYPGSFPSNLTVVGSTLFFSANDGTHGTELWKSDGTTAGTVMVDDINPGGAGSFPSCLGQCQRHPFLHGQRRRARLRALEERRHDRRHRHGRATSTPAPPAPFRRT